MKSDWDAGKAINDNWSVFGTKIGPVTDKNEQYYALTWFHLGATALNTLFWDLCSNLFIIFSSLVVLW